MSSNRFPYLIKPLEAEKDAKVNAHFLGFDDGSLEIGPRKYICRPKYGSAADIIYNFEVRPDDVWIISYPRSGSTLTQEIIWLILNDDYEKAASVPLGKRFSYLEFSTLLSDDIITKVKNEIGTDMEKSLKLSDVTIPKWEILANTTGRRFIKTHLPLSFLPPTLLSSGAKVIYVARNPKNVAVSRYFRNSSLKLQHFTGDFETYWDLFENNLLPYSPYWAHLEEAWQNRNNKNFLFLFFEDITKDYREAIINTASFLGKILDDSQISKLEAYVQIDKFRISQNPMNIVGSLFGIDGSYPSVRIGLSGNWNDYFDERLNARADKWIKENYKNTTLRFSILDLK